MQLLLFMSTRVSLAVETLVDQRTLSLLSNRIYFSLLFAKERSCKKFELLTR